MKPCSKNRKSIAWLALDALEIRKAATLRDHFALCEGCRRYWEEISNVTEQVSSAQPVSNLEASEFFHHRVAEELQAVESSSVSQDFAAWISGSMLNWRAALPALAVLVIALFAIVAPRPQSPLSLPAPSATPIEAASSSGSDLAPTVANYRMIANQSLEKLSELLSQQGNKSLPAAPNYTISSFELAHVPF